MGRLKDSESCAKGFGLCICSLVFRPPPPPESNSRGAIHKDLKMSGAPQSWALPLFIGHGVHVCAQSCLTLGDPTSLLCPWVFQPRILEQVAISSSRGSSPTQGSDLCLLHWQVDSLPLRHLGSCSLVMVSFKSPAKGWLAGCLLESILTHHLIPYLSSDLIE